MPYHQAEAVDQLLVLRATDSALRKRMKNRSQRISRWAEDIDIQSSRSSMTLVDNLDNDAIAGPSSVYNDDTAADIPEFPLPTDCVQLQPSDGSEDFNHLATTTMAKDQVTVPPQTFVPEHSRSPSPSTSSSSIDSRSTQSFPELLLGCSDCSARFPAMTRLFTQHPQHCKASTEDCNFCNTVNHFSASLGTNTPPKPTISTRTPLCDTFRELLFHHKAFHTSNILMPSASAHYTNHKVSFSCATCPPTPALSHSHPLRSNKRSALTTEHIIVDSVAGFPFFETREDRKAYAGGEDPAGEIERSMRDFYHPGSLTDSAETTLYVPMGLNSPVEVLSEHDGAELRNPLERLRRRLTRLQR